MSTTVSSGSTATFGMDAFASLAVVPSASDTRGTITFTSAAPNSRVPSFSAKLQAKEFGPFLAPMTVSIVVEDGSCTYQLTGNTGGYQYDSSGNVTGLVGPDGATVFEVKRYRSPMLTFSSAYGLTNTRQSGGTGDTLAADSTITRFGMPTVKLTLPTNGTYWAEVGFPAMTKTMARLRVGMLVYIPDYTKIGNITLYLAKESGYSNFVTCAYKIMDTGGNPNRYNGWHYITWPNSNATIWSVAAGTVADGDVIAASKVRVNPAGGTNSGIVNLHSMYHDVTVTKPSIIITADDGYDSWFNLGIPYLNAQGLKSTYSVVGSLVGTAGYATLAQLQDAYAAGHDFVTHGATNLTSLGTTALRIADVLANQQWLVANGFTRNQGWRHYVYPNGAYEMSDGDPEILGLVKQCNMLSGRGTQKPTRVDHAVDVGDRWYAYNILGGEDTESPATLTAAIDDCIAQGESGVLMFHKLVTGATAAAIEYNIDDFKTVVDHIAAKRNVGLIEVKTVPEWYASVRARTDAAVQ